jgi:hypothetical protein
MSFDWEGKKLYKTRKQTKRIRKQPNYPTLMKWVISGAVQYFTHRNGGHSVNFKLSENNFTRQHIHKAKS